jgi:bifunctional N-acetylglucosamine-1-phosphate-uridyltransferase/glucosamine-1-phosphate-acetyltransferase GlmU-like protein
MVIEAMNSLPAAENHIFVCANDHLQSYPLESEIKKFYPQAKIMSVKNVTEGQACTCEIGLQNEDHDAPLLIGACDNAIIFDQEKYQNLLNDKTIDAIAFSFRNNPTVKRNPTAYGYYVVDENGFVKDVSVKIPISENPQNDHAVVGTFYFRKVKYFFEGLQRLYSGDVRVHNEFYVDSIMGILAKMGKKIKIFEIENYICFGTPNDLKTFEYWQKYFNKNIN